MGESPALPLKQAPSLGTPGCILPSSETTHQNHTKQFPITIQRELEGDFQMAKDHGRWALFRQWGYGCPPLDERAREDFITICGKGWGGMAFNSCKMPCGEAQSTEGRVES